MPQPTVDLPPPTNTFVRRFVEPPVVIVCTLAFGAFVVGICILLLTGNQASGRDVISFWAAGRQIVHHANPYDADVLAGIERSVGFSDKAQTLIMRNPPSALALAIPLGFFSLRAGALLWSLLLLAAFALSVHLLWVTRGRPANKLHYLGYSFAPALTCILGGQSSLFALLGLVLFLRLYRGSPFVAGLSLWLCALKPHLFLPFGVALLLWIVVSRSYRLLAGATLAIAASSLVATYLDPAVWAQYNQMMHSSGIEREFIPCLGVALRFAIRPQAMVLQYIPAALGCVWAIGFYWRRRAAWNWMNDGALLMLVSILVSPYAWLSDQALLVPALLVGVYRATTRVQLGVLASASAFIEIAEMAGKTMHSALYLWFQPLWLAWYLYVSATARSSAICTTAPQEDRLAQSDPA
jgi:hypothetical protein